VDVTGSRHVCCSRWHCCLGVERDRRNERTGVADRLCCSGDRWLDRGSGWPKAVGSQPDVAGSCCHTPKSLPFLCVSSGAQAHGWIGQRMGVICHHFSSPGRAM